MVHAFIMVETGPGESERLLDSIRELTNVTEAHIVAGEYDIIVEADAGEVYEVLKISSNEIQGMEGVIDSRTYIAMDE